MHFLNEYVDISSTDFPVQSYRGEPVKPERMSRKIFKKVLFLLMFSGAILGMYTFFTGANDSDKRSEAWKGLINNMYIGADEHKGHDHSHDENVGHPRLPDKSRDRPSFGELVALRLNDQMKDVDAESDTGHEGSLNDERESGRERIPNDFVVPDDAKEEKAKLEDINVRDDSGNVIGQKLFAFGMSRDDIVRHNDHVLVKVEDDKWNNHEDTQENDESEDSVAAVKQEDLLSPTADINEDAYNAREEEAKEEVIINNEEYYRGDNEENENNDNEKEDVNQKPDVAIRDQGGQILGHKLYPFGIRSGSNINQDESLSSRKLQQEEPDHNDITNRQLKNIRPDAAFFDDKGNKKEGDAEMDRMTDFQQRMGLKNPFLKHKMDLKDPFHKHRALFRPLGAHGMNPALEEEVGDEDDDDNQKPKDAFADFDRDSVWGARDSSLFKLHPKKQQDEIGQKNIINTGHKNYLDNGFGMAPQGQGQNIQQQQPGQLMGYNTGKRDQNGQIGILNNGMPNRNLPIINGANENRLMGKYDGNQIQINPNQQYGEIVGHQFPKQDVASNNGQFVGHDNRQNQFAGQNAAWNHPNQIANGQLNQQLPIGLNNNNGNYNRYPLNNNFNNQNQIQNNAFGNVNSNNVPNQFANSFGRQQQQQQQQPLMGANGLNGNVGQQESKQMYPPQQVQRGGQFMGFGNGIPVAGMGGAGGGGGRPMGAVPNMNPIQQRNNAITPVQRNLEQQMVNPIDNNPLVNENVGVENTNEKEEELIIEDLTQVLGMTANCIPFPFPSGEASLCVPKMADMDEQEVPDKLQETGTWEPASLKQFSEILVSDPTIGVIDIGAGIGVYTIAAALMGRHVVAVEPLFVNYRLLHKTALNNNVATKIVMVAQALDKESYIGHMVYSKQTGEFNKVRIERLSPVDMLKDPANNVHVTTLDQVLKAVPFKKALLKIDVGGIMEADILKAGSKFFNSIDIPYILTHWNNDLDLNKKIQIASKMANLGYKPKLRWDGLILDPNSLHFSMDFLIWHKE